MLDFEGMRYTVLGAGPPVLLLHGWGSEHGCFARVARCLASDFTVYSVDFWGFGKSVPPPQNATVFDYADAVYRFVDEIIGQPAVLLGHSFGGRIALILGSRPLIRALVLVDSAGLRPRLGIVQKWRVARYHRAKRRVAKGQMSEIKLKKFGSRDYQNLSADMRAVFVRVVNQDLSEYAARVRCPVLLVWGRRDRTTPPRMARQLRRLLRCGHVRWLNGGHFCFLDSSTEFCAICYDFLIDLE